MIKITSKEQFEDFKSKLTGKITSSLFYSDKIIVNNTHELPLNCSKFVNENSDEFANDLIYGKDKTRNVVSIEVSNGKVFIYTETSEGVKCETRPFKYWIMSNRQPNGIYTRLDGDLYFKYMKEFDTEKEYKTANGKLYAMKADKYCCYDQREAYMVRHGLTYFKGMKVSDVSILSFDIETEGLDPYSCRTLLISNTFRKNGMVLRKLFSLDEFKNELEMLQAWTTWVREVDPSIILGHNIYSFDLKFLQKRLKICEETQVGKVRDSGGLKLGRDDSVMVISDKESKFRIDGTRDLHYNRISIFGREIIDTLFLAYRYDNVNKKYESYGLKAIIQMENLEKEGRIKWDFVKNKPKEFFGKDTKLTEMFKEYCECDSDDSILLYDMMVPPFFYNTQMIPKSFQGITESASGSQINLTLVRSYLQIEHSIPKATESSEFQGSISFGIPGVYTNCLKIDVASMFPSIQIYYEVYPKHKDPYGFSLIILKILRDNRLKFKKLYKETGDKLYDHLQNTMKVIINSYFGFMGASGLNFNYPEGCAEITRHGREIIGLTVEWASGKPIDYWTNKAKNGK